MWRPTPHQRWALPPLDAPTQAQARASRLFSPLRVGGMELSSRTWVPAMVPWRATPNGEVTEAVIRWYERFAQGRPGAIVVEATGIADIASGPLLRIGHARYEAGLQELVTRVKAASQGHTKVLIQLIDFLALKRKPAADRYFSQFLQLRPEHRAFMAARDPAHAEADEAALRQAMLALPERDQQALLSAREWDALARGYRERVDDEHLEHIAALPQRLPLAFAQATERARRVGFDGVELHYAHAYTMASFLSATNRRQDGYGSTLSGRLRLALEVLTACRAVAVPNFWVGLRMLSDECIPGGTDLSESPRIACALAAAGADFISLSRGGKFDDAKVPKPGEAVYPYTGRSGYECMPTVYSDARGPFGRNLQDCSEIRAALRAAEHDTPVVAAGGFCSFSQMESALASGQADIIGAARQSMADPDWWEKLRRGRGESIRRCSFTNYCEALDQRHKIVTCKLWDRTLVPLQGPDKSPDGHRRLIAPPWDDAPATSHREDLKP